MNENTLVSVHCYAGDAERVAHALPIHQRHNCPLVVLSPSDSKVIISGTECLSAGGVGYIGQVSLDRQLAHCELLLAHPSKAQFFLMNDSDSFCVSASIPWQLYLQPETFWSNEVTEPRPHLSPYPKIAAQPSYFCDRATLEKLVAVMPRIRAHPITPYIDWFMLACACESGVERRSFGQLEHIPRVRSTRSFDGDPWGGLAYRVRYCGAVMMHPIKFPEQVDLCLESRHFYESES